MTFFKEKHKVVYISEKMDCNFKYETDEFNQKANLQKHSNIFNQNRLIYHQKS